MSNFKYIDKRENKCIFNAVLTAIDWFDLNF